MWRTQCSGWPARSPRPFLLPVALHSCLAAVMGGSCTVLPPRPPPHLRLVPRRSALVYLFLRRSWPDRSWKARLLPLPAGRARGDGGMR